MSCKLRNAWTHPFVLFIFYLHRCSMLPNSSMPLQSMYISRLISQAYDGDKNGIIPLLDERLCATRKTILAASTARYISKSKRTTLLLASVIIAFRHGFSYTEYRIPCSFANDRNQDIEDEHFGWKIQRNARKSFLFSADALFLLFQSHRDCSTKNNKHNKRGHCYYCYCLANDLIVCQSITWQLNW